MRHRQVGGVSDPRAAERTGLSEAEFDAMYRLLGIANYEDRFVVPTTHREYAENAFDLKGSCGFTFGNGCSGGETALSLFGGTRRRTPPEQGEH
jgi:nitrate reductase beta subunit